MNPAPAAPKKILFITGTRADFGKLKPLIQRVKDAPDFDHQIFVTGMHLLSRYGLTLTEIQRAGFDHLYCYINQDAQLHDQMDYVLASTIQGLGHYVREFQPDLVVVHGDRVEALAGATVGALTNIRVAHIEGGELSGTVDELMRHAITKLSHLHFVSNADAKNRLVQMGEIPDTVYVMGSPDIDIMLGPDLPTLDEVRRHYDIGFDTYSIFVYHPVTTEVDRLREHIQAAVGAVTEAGQNFVVIYPNNDRGSEVILETLQPLAELPRFRLLPSMRFEYFLSLLKHARCIVGNSSAGIREAPVYGVPTINIGSRQLNRYHHASILNVADIRADIRAALNNIHPATPPSLYFGDGKSAARFMDALRHPRLWQVSRQKQFRDLSAPAPRELNTTPGA